VLFLAVTLAASVGPAERGALDLPIVFVQEPAGDGGPGAATSGAPGSRVVLRRPDDDVRVLTPEFAAAADPCVSFDGKRLLFAARREAGDPWDIWESGVDGSDPVRITRDLGDCREPAYLPRVGADPPTFATKVRWITFASTAPGVLDDQGTRALTAIYAMSLDPVPGKGTVVWRTTHDLGGDVSPMLLSDGRILFSSRQRGAFALMAMSWAGENLNPFFGSHDGTISQIGATELPDRAVVFVESETAEREAGGRLARVSLHRPLHSHEILAAGEGRYRTPHALPDGTLLVSHAANGRPYAVVRFHPGTGEREPVHADPAWHEVDAVPVVPRTVPPGRIPTVEFASVLDVGSLRAVGQLQCLNVYESDRPGAEGVTPGTVRTVRFVEGRPRPLPPDPDAAASLTAGAADSTWPPPGVETRILGEAPVETDGSFYVNVAADVPFYLETLDDTGAVVQTMRAWMWVRAGDQRGCIGCHEDKELAPENRATKALIRARPKTLLPPSAEAPAAGDAGTEPRRSGDGGESGS
jgi:hypothetical protein